MTKIHCLYILSIYTICHFCLSRDTAKLFEDHGYKIRRSQVGISSEKLHFYVIFKEVVRFIIKAIKYITNGKRLFATMLLFTCILSLTSCSKDDGDWDAMKWEKTIMKKH